MGKERRITGDHHRHVDAAFLGDFGNGLDRRLGVQGVEDGLDQEEVDPALLQAVDLLAIGVPQIIEGHGRKPGLEDVGEIEAVRLAADRAGDKARLAVLGADARWRHCAPVGRRRG